MKTPYSHTKAIIITPTIGTENLHKALVSVENQTYQDLIHLIVIDGESHSKETCAIIKDFNPEKIRVITLPYNTGKNGFNGHRIYAACAYLVNSEYVFFLDEDNWFDSNHVGSLIEIIENENLDWAHSLRKICSHNGEFIVNDDCESLGRWPALFRHAKPPHSTHPNLVDTSCYALKRDVYAKVGHIWNHPLGADRVFFNHLALQFPYFTSSALYSLNYRLHENRPPYGSYFKDASAIMMTDYNDNLPWRIL